MVRLLQFAKLGRHSWLCQRFRGTTHVGTLHGHKTRLVVFFSWARTETKTVTNKKAPKKKKKKTVCCRDGKIWPPQPCELGMTSWGIPLSTCNAPCQVTDKHTGVKREWRESCSKRTEETYRMDQPQDHKKGHVNLNVHATTQGDRHPSTQYNMWSRPSVEYHLPTRSKCNNSNYRK